MLSVVGNTYIVMGTEHFFPTPPSVTSHWQLEIGHSGGIYCGNWQILQIRALSQLELMVEHLYAQHCLAKGGTQKMSDNL